MRTILIFILFGLIGCASTAPLSIPVPASSPAAAPTPADLSQNIFPLALNNMWVYQVTRYDGFNPRDILTATLVMTETVTEIKTDTNFFAAKIRHEESADVPIYVPPNMQNMLQPGSASEYWLIAQGNRIYREEETPDLARMTDRDSLEFVFPLAANEQWVWLPARLPTDSNPDGVMRDVLKVGTVQVPAGRFDNCYQIQDGWVTNTVINWFCPGVGWVERKGDHNGTPVGMHAVLVKFMIESR
ncbi:MAG TPA: hypothetical protein VFD70_14895 [Anaerolineae bacterium]|nr:hypothetical protein [Anaerolineae bacterium]